MVLSKVENLQFYLSGLIWVTRLSGAFGYNQVFLGIFIIGMNKFLLKFRKSKMAKRRWKEMNFLFHKKINIVVWESVYSRR